MPVAVPSHPHPAARAALVVALLGVLLATLLPTTVQAIDPPIDHLVVSEVATGGASASDELIELYNPTSAARPLEGLELIYVSSTGATITRRTAWALGAPVVPAGGHVLVANDAGTYAPIADALYSSGMAATGGSVALRVLGASTAIDAVGWGTAASTWREGTNAPAPATGSSIERLPGGSSGSTRDTDDNGADFVERIAPEPQNLGSAPTPAPGDASPTPLPTPAPSVPPSATPTPAATPAPTPDATPMPTISIAAARAVADGTVVTVEATASTESDFHDGGGFVADDTGGIAVLLSDGAFARGERLRITGSVDDRFSQRTIRASASGITELGMGSETGPTDLATGSVDESVEGRLVRVTGSLVGGATILTTGTAFDLDDGTSPVRVVVASASGIDLTGWTAGTSLELVGVVGQRDSTGTGLEGYRVMPRDGDDVVLVDSPASPSPEPSSTSTASPTPTASADPEGVGSVTEARAAAKNARLRVRGVVTLQTGVVDAQTAVIQDAGAAIVLRLSDDVGAFASGEWVEVTGTRSTKSGMETIRVTEPPMRLGTAPLPTPRQLRSGEVGEAQEAVLVVVRGALVASARRAASGSVSFEIDDGSGPLRISAGAPLEVETDPLMAGTWVEVRGVVGQETTGAQPLRGYRIWPSSTSDIRIVAGATEAGSALAGGPTNGELSTLETVGGADLAELRVAATLVAGRWPELGVAGILWDGVRLVAIAEESAGAVTALRGARQLPLAVELAGLAQAGREAATGAPIVRLGTEPGAVLLTGSPPAPPRSRLDGERPAWVSLVGRLEAGPSLRIAEVSVALEYRCDAEQAQSRGTVAVLGIATGDPTRVIVPCGGITPAPAIALAAQAHAGSEARPPAASIIATSGQAPDAPTRSLVGALLGAAALVVAAAAAWAWRHRDTRDGPAGRTSTAEPDEPVEGRARLTLVSMPREHGP